VTTANAFLQQLPDNWDIVIWGWNFSAFLWVEMPEGVSFCKLEMNQAVRRNIDAFRVGQFTPTPIRLRHCFGPMAYTVSADGAAKLLNSCLPLRDQLISFPGFDVVIQNTDIDAMMNAVYPGIRAYVSISPLAVSSDLDRFGELLALTRKGDTVAQFQVKLELNQRYGSDWGFRLFRQLMSYPASAHLRPRPVSSVKEVAEQRAAVFHLLEPAGESFVLEPPQVINCGNHRTLHGVSRSMYVAAFERALLQGWSQLVRVGDEVLLDFEGSEFDSVDDQLEIDSAVFQHQGRLALLIEDAANRPPRRIEECFSLLAPSSLNFGHWVGEYLPRLAAALSSVIVPDVPVLIDADLPRQHRQSLALLLPKSERIIEIAPGEIVEAGKLWYAPTYYYAPVHAEMNDRYSDDLVAAPPARFARLVSFMKGRFRARIDEVNGPERIFLARRPLKKRRLVNYQAIEAIAVRHGFSIIYMEDHDFADQLRLIRNARFVTGPDGSAFFTTFFAEPGTRLAILNHRHTELLSRFTALLNALEVKTTVITGPFTDEDPIRVHWSRAAYPHFGNYEIDEGTYARFLEGWLADERV